MCDFHEKSLDNSLFILLPEENTFMEKNIVRINWNETTAERIKFWCEAQMVRMDPTFAFAADFCIKIVNFAIAVALNDQVSVGEMQKNREFLAVKAAPIIYRCSTAGHNNWRRKMQQRGRAG